MNTWAIVELMGHGVTAGRLSSEGFDRTGLLRLKVPASSESPELVRYLGPGAIYGVTPCSESVARRVVEKRPRDGNAMALVYDPDVLGKLSSPMDEIDPEAAREADEEAEMLPF